ncbi:hypothetical protein [Lysinibacillus telephonicus]|uniref:Uncharacterized protein n=1 Tax=Lysinibacillus telephonicus TaxID=1714840 RepID=A0A3S0JPK0_9BACI|nr:hypothetical protein [Lysinibacillus telephonicus]RTQ92957.1 hypothetical protein EKG35_10450 [Lysinibacillus telephonicus]
MENKQRKQVDSIHLLYVSIIFGGIIVLLLAFIFNKSNYAGELLNFAATLSSILLAVIAIVITLIDVAGQRNNIFDVKNSVENLKEVSKEIESMVKSFNEQNEDNTKNLLANIQKFAQQQDEIKVVVDGLMQKIENLPSDNKDIKEIKEEANKVKTVIEKQNYKGENIVPFSDVKFSGNWQNKVSLSDLNVSEILSTIEVPSIKAESIKITNNKNS